MRISWHTGALPVFALGFWPGAILAQDVGESWVKEQVQEIRQSDTGGWNLGCNFIRSLSEEDLRGLV